MEMGSHTWKCDCLKRSWVTPDDQMVMLDLNTKSTISFILEAFLWLCHVVETHPRRWIDRNLFLIHFLTGQLLCKMSNGLSQLSKSCVGEGPPHSVGAQNRKVRDGNRLKNGSGKDEERPDKYTSLSRRVTNDRCVIRMGIGSGKKREEGCERRWGGFSVINKTITDGGVAPPPLLLTIVLMSSNLKNLRISRNSKDSIEG